MFLNNILKKKIPETSVIILNKYNEELNKII